MHALGEKGEWGQVSKLARQELSLPKLSAEHHPIFTAVRTQARRLESLAALRSALERGPLPRLSDQEVVGLSALQTSIRGLHSLDEVGAAVKTRWEQPPHVPTLERNLEEVQRATGDGKLTDSLRWRLAVKAAGEGHPAAAKALVPADSRERVTVDKLRDMAHVLAEKGDAGAAGGSGPAPKPPLPIPEPDPKGTRPAPKGSILEGLPSLENMENKVLEPKMAAARKQLHDDLTAAVGQQMALSQLHLNAHLGLLRAWSREARQLASAQQAPPRPKAEDQQEEQPVAAVAKRIGRKLTPAERILVLQMWRHGKGPAEMAKILRGLETAAPKA
jgi:hypothetical protein